MKKILFGFSILAVTLLFLGNFVEAERVQHGSLMKARGVVQYRAAGTDRWVTATERMRITQGDRIKTGANGEAVIRISPRNFIAVRPNSEVAINLATVRTERTNEGALGIFGARREVQNVEAGLERGAAVNVLKGLGTNSEFRMRTPVAVAGVRGTIFSSFIDALGNVGFACSEGAVNVTSTVPGGFDPVDIGPGDAFSVAPTGAPSEVAPAPPTVMNEMSSNEANVESSSEDFSTTTSPQQEVSSTEVTAENEISNY